MSLIGEAEAAGIYSQIEGQCDTCFLTDKVLVRNFPLINVMSIGTELENRLIELTGYLLRMLSS